MLGVKARDPKASIKGVISVSLHSCVGQADLELREMHLPVSCALILKICANTARLYDLLVWLLGLKECVIIA